MGETFFSEEHGEEQERVPCPSCGAEEAAPFRVAHDRLFGRPGRYHVVRCATCAMTYTNPRPSFDALSRHYPDDYFCYEPPDSLRGIRRFLLGGIARALVARRLRLLERGMGPGLLQPGARVCDVGCSYGELLAALHRERSCDVVGVDFNPDMVAACERRGIAAVLGTLEQAAFETESFDVVTMTEYLEHEGRPLDVLRECRRVTKPGGFLAIEVPLISTGAARLFGNFWSQLDLPRHLMFFTPATLRSMLERAGFEVQSVRTVTGSIGMSLLHVLGYERIGRMTTRDLIASVLATLPFLPVLPFMREFMFVVARARTTRPLLLPGTMVGPSGALPPASAAPRVGASLG